MKILKDVRYFDCTEVPGAYKPAALIASHRVDLPKSVHSIGQRIARLLQGEAFGVGDYDHVYIAFSPELADREIIATDYGLEPWHRFVACGVPADFASWVVADKHQRIQEATLAVLAVLNPDGAPVLQAISDRLAAGGDRTRILRASKDTRAYRFEVWFDVPSPPERAHLYVVAYDNASGQRLEAPPIRLESHEDAFPLVSAITFSKDVLRLKARTSFRAQLYTRTYPDPIEIPLSAFVPA